MDSTEITLKRLRIRSWRRGMKEMDIILGGFADTRLASLAPERLAGYERLLEENDQDLFLWVTGRAPVPEAHAGIVAEIRDGMGPK
ncbi:succinate dehydrogenase assembly factor 2 [Paroceanicella profunda]|uniref:FAD assembly factor SdhE n=1 Tax=Paroceanicella profunda TaxID=2579971 RepID=A0A5B8FVN4_9RHOB|nr:succinate dehydrogenase assembly factor 2 [Paroceanicella profunda]QDL92495.1 succinate dehydrogenase assembly factor 2 [Paroceanicella profunda]